MVLQSERPEVPALNRNEADAAERWLRRWESVGALSPEAASAVRAFESERAGRATAVPGPASPTRTAVPVIAEILSYIGAALAVSGVLLVVVRAWPDLATWARILITGGTTLLLLALGGFIDAERDPIRSRLRAVVWLAAAAGATTFGIVLMRDVWGTTYGASIAWAGATAAFAVSAACWRARRRPVQEIAALIALAVAVGTGIAITAPPGVPGIALWILAAAYIAFGLSGRRPDPIIPEIIGCMVAFAACIELTNAWIGVGMLIGVTTALVLLALVLVPGLVARRADRIVFGVAGAFLLVEQLPAAIGYYATEAGIATGILVWLVGLAATGLGISRRLRLSPLVESGGAALMLIGAAVTGAQRPGFATIFGLVTAVALLGVGFAPGRILLVVFGSTGVLVFVPWAIAWYFPGENRAPLLVTVSGILVLVVALGLARSGRRFRQELGSRPDR